MNAKSQLRAALEVALASMKKNGVAYGCLCEWDEDGNPIGSHGPLCGKSFHADAIEQAEAALAETETP